MQAIYTFLGSKITKKGLAFYTDKLFNLRRCSQVTFLIGSGNFKDIQLETNLTNVVFHPVDKEAAHRHRRRRVHKVRPVLARTLRAHQLEETAYSESRRASSL